MAGHTMQFILLNYIMTSTFIHFAIGSDVKRILMLADTALYGDGRLERIRSTLAKTVFAHGGVATSVWMTSWDSFTVHDTIVRHNAIASSDDTLLVTVTICRLCDMLLQQSDINGIPWIGICHYQGHLIRDDVTRHMILCQWYYRQLGAIRHLVEDMHLNDTVLLYDAKHASVLATEIIRQQQMTGHVILISDPGWMTSPQWAEFFWYRGNNQKQRVYVMSTQATDSTYIFEKASMVSPRCHWLIDMTSSINGSCALPGVVYLTLSEEANTSYRLVEFLNCIHTSVVKWLTNSAAWRNGTEDLLGGQCNTPEFTKPRTPQSVSPSAAVFDLRKCMTAYTSSSCCKPTTVASYNDVGRLGGLTTAHDDIFPKTFPGFYGRRLRVVTKYYPPFVKLINGAYTGLCIELLDTLARTLNFSYDLFEVPDGKFGIIDEWGVWNGMIGVVHRKEADIAAAALTITADRETVVDFSFPYWEEPSGVLIRRPPESSKVLALLKPLQWTVWLTVIFEILLASGVIYACTLCTNRFSAHERDSTMTTFENCLWYTFGTLVNQSVTPPTTSASRLVASALCFVTVAVYAAFTGNMVAILAVEKRTLPFNNLDEMVQQTDYTWGTEDGIVQMMLFQRANGGIYSEIWDGMTSHSGSIVKESESGFRKTRTENYAFIGDKTYLGSYAAGDCDLTLLPEEFYKVGFGFAFPKDWPYTEYMNDIIMNLRECGFVNRWKQKHWPRPSCRMTDTRLSTRKFTLADMEGNFYVICIGALVSFGVLLLECIRPPLLTANVSRDDDPSLEKSTRELRDVGLCRMRK